MALAPTQSYTKKEAYVKTSKWNDEMKMVQYNQSGHVSPPTLDTRAEYQDTDPFYFIMYIDIHDFCPKDVTVEIVDNGTAIVVSAIHAVDFKSEKEDQIHDESRSISERFTLPSNLNIESLQWNFTPDKRKIFIVCQKCTETLSVDTIQNFRNIEKREVVIEQPNDAPLVFLQSFPQPFPGHEQDQSSFARNIYANTYGYNQNPNSTYSNYTGYNPSLAGFNNNHSSSYPNYFY